MSVNIGICGMAACCITYVALNKLVYWLQSPQDMPCYSISLNLPRSLEEPGG